ncbi:hypothetical protein BDN72DRAFT_748419, partial [Pluteus cervinus]
RTLLEIVRSCLLTIAACVYRSIHPNVPDPEATNWRISLNKLKISFYALIAPEAMMWWAIRQWYGARMIAQDWTMTHGHNVQMGAIQLILPNGSRQVLNPLLLHTYLKRGMINPTDLRFPQKIIEDRSKGDFLSKGIVILQTSWFVLECLARFQQHLPVTELEVVTLAFALLNVITYALWWYKPLDVHC